MFIWLIAINEIRQISRKKLDFARSTETGPKLRKLQEAIWLTVINEIFKLPPHFDSFYQVNYFYGLSWSYPTCQTQKWHIWASFQTSRERFRKLQEAIWLTVINEIFKFPSHFDPYGYVNYLYELSPGYPNHPTQKWNIWASFQTSRKRFPKCQEAIWLTRINKICKFQLHLEPFSQSSCLFERSWVHLNYLIKK